eukprot:jgi/Botrbrau1/21834/Bobra.0190s0048.1
MLIKGICPQRALPDDNAHRLGELGALPAPSAPYVGSYKRRMRKFRQVFTIHRGLLSGEEARLAEAGAC